MMIIDVHSRLARACIHSLFEDRYRTLMFDPTEFLDFLQDQGDLDKEALERARNAQKSTGRQINSVLIELGIVNEDDLTKSIANYLGLDVVLGSAFPDIAVASELLDQKFLEPSKIIPLELTDKRIVVATPQPFGNDALEMMSFLLGREVVVQVAKTQEFDAAFKRIYAEGTNIPFDQGEFSEQSQLHSEDVERLKDSASQAPIIKLVMRVISDAVLKLASDIHIEPREDRLCIRFRIDGVLRTVETIDKNMQSALISRIKILARLNIAERRLPQDGRIKLAIKGRETDFRVSTTPTLFGESIVLRILDKSEMSLTFEGLGFNKSDTDLISEMISFANGVVLVTGPTGSGKTTTLYAALKSLNNEERKLFSVEDPVEYQLSGVNQMQVHPQIDLDFARSLRSILRQDPDVIMVGEIRDSETAKISTQAALTGHMVLSTVHTNSAIGTLSRLVDMGVEDFLLTSTLRGIIAQRLVRKVCQKCCSSKTPSIALLARLKVDEATTKKLLKDDVVEGTGCSACQGTGYKGRTTIYEILPMSAQLKDAFLDGKTETQLFQIARELGFRSLQESGIDKVCEGITTIDEVIRASLVN